jgi:hypothetical protein
MNKVKINGTFESIYIKSLPKAKYMQIQSALGKSLFKHTHLLLDDSNLIAFDYKSIDDFQTVKQFTGFRPSEDDTFQMYYGKKEVIKKPLAKLQNHFYSLDLFNTSLEQVKFNFRKENDQVYFFLKKELSGLFSVSVGENCLIHDIQITHHHLNFRKGIESNEDYLSFRLDGKALNFTSKKLSNTFLFGPL